MRVRGAAALLCVVLLTACGGDEGSAEELCAAVRSEPSVATVFRGFDPTDTDAALGRLREARVTLGELRDAAPAEARDDLTVEIDYVQALIEGLEGVDSGDPADAVAVVQQVEQEHPDVTQAAANLAAFAESSCG
ncbi:MAG: hypothetical protein ABWZ76_13295 [Acidimicrobiales bacterium]